MNNLPENFTQRKIDLMILNNHLHTLLWDLDEDQRIKNILETAEIILYYILNWFYYTTGTYCRMVELKDSAQTYLNTTMTNNGTARRLIKRFEEVLEHTEREIEMEDDLEI